MQFQEASHFNCGSCTYKNYILRICSEYNYICSPDLEYCSKLACGTSLVVLHGGPYFPARVPILPVEWGPGVPQSYGVLKKLGHRNPGQESEIQDCTCPRDSETVGNNARGI